MNSSSVPCNTPPSTPVSLDFTREGLPDDNFVEGNRPVKADIVSCSIPPKIVCNAVGRNSGVNTANTCKENRNGTKGPIDLADVEKKLNNIELDADGNQVSPPNQTLCNGNHTPSISPSEEQVSRSVDQSTEKSARTVTNNQTLDSSISSTPVISLPTCSEEDGIRFEVYTSEIQMPSVMELMGRFLSEPYSVYTYRYFIHNWPKLCFLACDQDENIVGAIVCKLDVHKQCVRRGYIAMLAVDNAMRLKGIGSKLVKKAISAMANDDCDEVVLETEVDNRAALKLYENLGFVRDKRLFKYYLNGVDAFRLKLWLR